MSTSVNYENQILNAIETVVNNAVNNAGYDKTIKAQIIEKTNEAIGEYKVRYQDSTFFAYSNDIDVNYPKNSLVYILVPNNDMRQVKTIIGAVEKTEMEYAEVLEAEDYYDIIGTNVVNYDNEFSLCSYNGSSNIVLFDKDNNINLVNFDEQAFKTYLTNRYNILCGGWFKITLDDIQKNRGNYGITFDMQFKDPLDDSHILTKSYVMDVNNMEGNPYNFNNFTRQASVFNIDTDNYIGLEKITFFAKDFPKTESGHDNDIFLKTPLLYVVEEIPEAVLNGYSVRLVTNKNYFNEDDTDDTTTVLQTIVKRKGKELSDTQSIQYLWFKENAEVYPAMPGFNSYGGSGWECLNEFNILDDSDPTNIQKEYITNQSMLEVAKSECQALNNNYKVVVLIGEGSSVETSIIIRNYDYEYNLSISSDEGTEFYYGNGTPTLTALVNGHENNNFSYKWVVVDENNITTILEDTTTDNTTYNNAVSNYNTLKEAIAAETVLPNAVQEQLDSYLQIINSFDTKQRVEGNKIHKIQINEIPTYSVYKCSVYNEGDLIGTASIKLNNYPKIEGEYFLNIINGTQTFNYNSAGVAPTSTTLEHPMTLPSLTFTIVDGKGNALPDRIVNLCRIQWLYDENQSLIDVINYDSKSLNYTLAEKYDISKINTSNITLKVSYQTLNLQAQTNFTFVKDGEPGTNGTDIICKIVPYTEDENFNEYPILYYNTNGDHAFNFAPISNYRWFKVQLWKDNNIVWEGVNSKKRDEVIVRWSVLENKYGNNVKDLSHIRITESSGLEDTYLNYTFYFNNIDNQLAANQYAADIVKAEVIYKDKKYYATLPVITVKTEDWIDYNYSLVKNSGFRYVTYTTDGCYPLYENTTPFTIKVTQKINGYTEDISNLSTNPDYKLTYDWTICGSDYYKNNTDVSATWHKDFNLIEGLIEGNKAFYSPVEECDGRNVSNAIRVTISQNNSVIGTMNIPIHFYLNRYGISALNDWDGNHIELNDQNDRILAPQVGAGKKESDNSFTGILMGEVLESGKEKSQYGLYGYYQGDRTIELNSENGSARFGKTGAGQIILDPTDNTAKLRSGNYVAPVLDQDGNIVTAGSGLEIDLTDPHLIFGSGKFRVDNDGSVHATEYTTISGLAQGDYEVPSGAINIGDSKNLNDFMNATDQSLEDLQDQIDGNITTWFYDYVPTLANKPASDWTTTAEKNNHLGDLFYDTSTGYCYRFMKSNNVYSWQQLSDSDIAAALAAAQAAQDTADNKRRVFYNTPTPPYDEGDLWSQGENGDLLRCATAKTSAQSYSLTDWVLASKYTDDTAANTVQQNLDNLSIGGRNYLLKSDVLKSDTRNTTNKFIDIPFSTLIKELPDTTEFTISYLAKSNAEANDLKIDFYLRNSNNSMSTLYTMDSLTTEYKRYSHVIKADTGKHLSDVAFCRFRLGAGSGTAYIKEYKLETGNRATAWSPAPEDNIESLVVEYYLSTSNTTTTGGTWSTTAPVWENGKYMWSRQKVTYGNGTVVTSNETCIAGATGQDGYTVLLTNESQSIAATTTAAIATSFSTNILGFKGSTAKNTIIGASSSATTFDTGVTGITATITNNNTTNASVTFNVTTSLVTKTGQITIPITIDGITFNKKLSFSLSMTGAKGDSITITTKNIQYKLDDSGTTPPASGWENNIPNPLTKGKYLWTKTYVKYSDNTETTSYSVSYVAVDGDAGRGISSTEVKYIADTQGVNPPSDSASWNNNPPSGDTKGKYIWTRTRITYTDGQNPTTSYSVAYKGTDGSSITITSQVIEYAEGTSGTSHDNLTWQTTIPAVADEHYLWTRTTVNYSDNTTTVSYSVSYQSKDGQDATQYYTHVMYAEDSSGTGISSNPSGKSYIGIKIDTTQTASTVPGDYTWSKFVGEDGTSGTDGFSLWTTTVAPTSSVYTRSQLTGPTALQTPRVGEIIIRSNRYQYTITAVSGDNITVGSAVDLKGSSGTSATNIVCGNEAQVIACNVDGAVTSATTITIPFAGYVGSSRKACSVTYSTLPDGMTLVSNTAATTSADGALILAVSQDATLGNIDNGVITLTFTCNSLNFTKVFAWSKSKAGLIGEDGVGIQSIVEYYLASTKNSGVTVDDQGWSTTIPTISIDPVLKNVNGDAIYLTDSNEDYIQKLEVEANIESQLPADYTRREYVKTTGTQYFNFDYYSNANSKYELTVKFDNQRTGSDWTNGWQGFFGGVVGSATGDHRCSINFGANVSNQTNQLYIWTKYGQNVTNQTVVWGTLQNRNTMIVIDGSNFIYGANYRGSMHAFENTATQTLLLGAGRNSTTQEIRTFNVYDMTIYEFKIYESGTLIHHYIPCSRNSDEKLGLYDIISNKFYYNQGTNEFITNNNDIKIFVSGKNIVGELEQGGFQTSPAYVAGYQDDNSPYIRTKNFIRANTGDVITGSYSVNSSTDGQVVIFEYDENYRHLRFTYATGFVKTTTLGNNTKYIKVRFLGGAGTTISDYSNVQVEKNGNVTVYEPYKENSLIIDLGNNSFVKNNYHTDSIIVEDGQATLHKKFNKIILNGTETITTQTNASAPLGYYYTIPLPKNANYPGESDAYKNLICSKLTPIPNTLPSLTDKTVTISTSKNKIAIGFDGTDQQLSAWLSENPVTLYYVLETEEDIVLEDGVELSLFNNISYITNSRNANVLVRYNSLPLRYLWNYTLTTFTDSNDSHTDPVLIGVAGSSGKSITSITEEYYLSTSKESPQGGSWVSSPPAWEFGKYIWTRSKITYFNPISIEYTTAQCSSEWEAIDEIEIGGRNLITGSKNFKNASAESSSYVTYSRTANDITINRLSNGSGAYGLYQMISAKAGQTYTFSLEVIAVTGDMYFGLGKNSSWRDLADIKITSTGRKSITVTAPEGTTQIRVYIYGKNAGSMTVKDLKLEIGNKNTDWTPAPEDVETEIVATVTEQIDTMEIGGRNYLTGTSGQWTNWIYPGTGTNKITNIKTFDLTTMNLEVGDKIAIQIEVETADFQEGVTQFYTQGPVNRTWSGDKWFTNPWNASLINLSSNFSKYNSVKKYTNITTVTQTMIDIMAQYGGTIGLQIRVDNANEEAKFRYRKIKIEKGSKHTDWTAAPEDVETGLKTYIDTNVQNLQNQIDGAIQFWNGAEIPTLNNYPANQWTTEAEKTNHMADIYTIIQDVSGELKQGKGYRFDKVNNNWVWVEITDQEMSAVQALAASKAKVFVIQPTVPYNVGDLWLKDGDLYRCITAKTSTGSYALADWVLATDYTDDTYAQQVQQNLDNLSIGARNFLLNSNKFFLSNSDNWNYTSRSNVQGRIEVLAAGAGKKGNFYRFGTSENFSIAPSQLTSQYPYLSISLDIKVSNMNAGKLDFTISARNGGSPSAEDKNSQTLSLNYNEITQDTWFRIKDLCIATDYTAKGSILFVGDFDGANEGAVLEYRNIKLETGNRSTDWTPAPEDVAGDISTVSNRVDNYISSKEIVVGTQVAQTRFWTGLCNLASLQDGDEIVYWLPYADVKGAAGDRTVGVDMRVDASTTKTAGTLISSFENSDSTRVWLNLTLKDGTSTTGWIPCYYGGTTRLTTHYDAGNAIHFTYRVNADIAGVTYTGWFGDANYYSDSNTYDRIRFNNVIRAKSAITASCFIAGDTSGYFKLLAGSVFDLDKPILWAASAIGSGATASTNYLAMPSCSMRNNTNSSWTATQYETLYLVGTINGNQFTVDSTTPFTTTKPVTEDGKIYMQFGYMYGTYSIYLYPEHPLFKYVNGQFKSLDQVAYEAQSDFDTMEIGGRNYLYKSNTEKTWNRVDTNTWMDIPFNVDIKNLSDDTIFTISYFAKCNEDANNLKVDFYLRDSSSAITPYYSGDLLTTEYTRFVHQIKASSDKHLINTAYCRFRLMNGAGTVYVKDYKLEVGNKVTAWTPAPEDNVQSLDVEYYLSTSSSTTTGGSWSTTAPSWEDGKYMWSRQKVTYGNGTIVTRNETCIAGATGSAGTGMKNYGTRTWSNSEITNTYVVGYSSQWTNNLSVETKVGDLLLLYVTNSTYNTKYNYILEVTTGASASGKPTAKIVAITKDGDAPIVDIVASSQVFKSTDGSTGTFTPEYIYLYPIFKNCAYSKWQYSTDGTSWTNVTSGSHGLTISTYNSMANSLRISRSCDLYTDSITSLSFKCVSGVASAYDISSVVKLYDIGDIEIGGRNYAMGTSGQQSHIGSGTTNQYTPLYLLVDNFNKLFLGKQITVSAEVQTSVATTGTFCFYGNGDLYDIGCPTYDIADLSISDFTKFSYTYTYPSDSALDTEYIGIRTDNYTGTLTIQKFKIEIGTQATDWSVAYEDLDNTYALEYTTTVTKEVPGGGAIWSDSLGAFENNVYVWQRSVIKNTHSNVISFGNPICIYIPSQTIDRIETQYKIHTSKEVAPTDTVNGTYSSLTAFPTASATYINQIYKALDTNIDYICQLTSSAYSWQEYSSWLSTKPIWTAEQTGFLWSRIKYTYANPTKVAYSLASYDNSWENYSSLSTSIKNISDEMADAIQGTVEIKGGAINVYNNTNVENATARVVINTAGIGFVNKEGNDWGSIKTVWGYNTATSRWEFNAEGINVINLSADEIEDGILTLRGTDLTLLGSYNTLAELNNITGSLGDAYYVNEMSCPYSWDTTTSTWVKRPGGEFLLSDKDGAPVCSMDVDGFICYANDGSKVRIKTVQDVGSGNAGMVGLQLYDINNNLIAWTNTITGTWSVKKQSVEESIMFGSKIKLVVLSNGIGFVATTSN